MPSILLLLKVPFGIVIVLVLNLVINGMPSIPINVAVSCGSTAVGSFKPCYKWNAFNTMVGGGRAFDAD